LGRLQPKSADDIRNAGVAVARFSEPFDEGMTGLKAFLFKAVYRHERVMRVMRGAEAIVADLAERYVADSKALPPTIGTALGARDEAGRALGIGDFIAGMTDRFALAEHRRLFDATPDLL
jgi:dGTPase